MREPEHRADQDVQLALLLVDVADGEAGVRAEAGVVDQQGDRPAAVGQPFLDLAALVGVGQVGAQHLDAAAVPVDEVLGLPLEPVGGPCDDDEVPAGGGQPLRERGADAGGRAGDQCSSHAATLPGPAGAGPTVSG